MNGNLHLEGKCLCGAIKLSANAKRPSVVVCHCDMCRRWSAGPFMSVTCQNVTFDGDDKIGRIRSSDRAERGFCSTCGSNLFYRLVESSDYQFAAGLFDNPSILRMSLQVFSDRKPDFYALANETKMMTAADMMAMSVPKPT